MLAAAPGEAVKSKAGKALARRRRGGKWQSMRAALRTLTVLRALNVRNGASVGELAVTTGISRPALYRILETLREAGYIAVDLQRRHYCLTILVRTLADGFTDEDWVTHVARPAIAALQRAILWPVDLGTFMDNAMWIRETTRPLSTFTIDRGVAGSRFPMLPSATGRAYLAFCPEDEREQILRNLAAARESGFEIIHDRPRLDALLAQVRARGYGHRYGEPPKESGAIAVPILIGTRVLGCVNTTFAVTTHTPQQAAREHLTAMRHTAEQIAKGYQQLELGAIVSRNQSPGLRS